MNYKSYADALRNGKFKKKEEKVQILSIEQNIKKELKEFLVENLGYGNSKSVYTKLFKKNTPVKLVFKWIEDDYQGSLFVIYEYTKNNKKYYIYTSGGFGSCSGCDYWANILECKKEYKKELIELLNKMEITDSKELIEVPLYAHPDLKLESSVFKNIES